MACLIAFSAAFAIAADKRFEKKFNVASGGTLTLNTDVGSVTISGTSTTEVEVVVEIRGRQRDIDEFDIKAEYVDKGVEVRGKNHRSGLFNWNNGDFDVRFTVKVPREYNLRMRTSGGDIEIDGVKGSAEGQTSGGDLRVRDFEGGVRLTTSGGNILAEKITGNLNMETSGGDITMSTVKGNVDVQTSGGNIKIGDVEGKVHAETSGGNVAVRVTDGNKGIFAETSGGNIDIAVPKNIAATIDASTSGGEVSCDLPITMQGKISDSKIRGTVNGGGESIHAHTSGGDIRIRTRE
jgi:DUF4097 and DUF4098 domain-containing protein YvlB